MGSRIPKWLRRRLRPSDLERIESAVEAAEKSTAGEIVPMIVRRSACTGHVPLILLLVLFLMLLALDLSTAALFHRTWGWGWWALDLALIFPIAFGLSKIDFVVRLLTPSADLAHQVATRAEIEFYETGLH